MSARRSGRSQAWPCVRPVSAPTGFVAALKMTLRHCAGRASATAWDGIPPRVHASARRSTSSGARRSRLERPERRVALDVPLHDTGLEHLAGGERGAADHALDVAGERLLVADAVHDRRDGAVGERVRGRGDRRLGVHRLRRDDAELARRQLCRVARRMQPGVHLAGAREPQAVRVDRGDVRRGEVERPHLDVVERREVGREQRADCPAADDADPHGVVPSVTAGGAGFSARRHAGIPNSRPPVMPDGRRISISAIAMPRITSAEPSGMSSLKPMFDARLGLAQERVEPADDERAEDGPPEARRASDDEHRERQEREIEVDLDWP